MRLGSKGAVETGSSSSMQDLESPIDKKKLLDEVPAQSILTPHAGEFKRLVGVYNIR